MATIDSAEWWENTATPFGKTKKDVLFLKISFFRQQETAAQVNQQIGLCWWYAKYSLCLNNIQQNPAVEKFAFQKLWKQMGLSGDEAIQEIKRWP